MSVESLLAAFLALGGVGALIAALVNIAKTVGWVKDGQAPAVATGLNLLGMILLFVVGIVAPDFDVEGANQFAAQLANVLVVVFGFAWQLISSRITHEKALKGAPLVGKSYALEHMREAEASRNRAYVKNGG